MTGRCTRWERWLPGSGGRFKVLNCNLHSFQLFEIIQVLDSISWVRCASGNVLKFCLIGQIAQVSDPRPTNPFNKTYSVDCLGNMVG